MSTATGTLLAVNTPTVAFVHGWLFIGSREACAESVGAQVCVHINRADYPQNDCIRLPHSGQDAFLDDYRDGEMLSGEDLVKLDALAAQLRDEAQRGDKRRTVLVHCAAGVCRSPHVAAYLLAMVDFGLHPMEAFARVDRAVYDQRGMVCNWVHAPRKQIIERVMNCWRSYGLSG